MREKLAAHAHEMWAVKRWQRQIQTPYAELSETEKESDRKETDEILDIYSLAGVL